MNLPYGGYALRITEKENLFLPFKEDRYFYFFLKTAIYSGRVLLSFLLNPKSEYISFISKPFDFAKENKRSKGRNIKTLNFSLFTIFPLNMLFCLNEAVKFCMSFGE